MDLFALSDATPRNARPIIVDSFAGGGGASTGILRALGRSPDIAINHNAAALAMHEANHPETLHLSKNIWKVDPLEAVRGRPVGLAWFSPDCKHFSKAKGGKPVKRNVRDLAWTVILWAKRVRPAGIILENVEEFQEWGPLVERDGRFVPCSDRRGQTFERWLGELRRLGYRVEFRELVGADYGAPTTRKRLFLIARRDGLPIVWPRPTHGKPSDPDVVAGRKRPWRTAADHVIDWSIPCPSIFETSDEIFRKYGVRAIRPLADATLARIARGTKRYVIDAAKPFVVKFRSRSTGHSIDEPLHTVTANSFESRPGGAAPLGLVSPSLIPITHRGDVRTYSAEEPLRTITTANGGEIALVAPSLVSVAHGDSGGRREYEVDAPLGTVTAGGGSHAIAATFLSRQFGKGIGCEADGPVPTVTEINKTAVVAAFMAQHNNDSRRIGGVNPGRPADEPLSTITTTGSQQGLVAASLTYFNSSNVAAAAGDPAAPLKTVTAEGTHAGLVAAFLAKYYGEGGADQAVEDPLHTVTTKARMGLVTVEVDGQTYAITDIGLRMLTPRELFNAQGFPPDYRIDDFLFQGRRLTKAEQIACCGNSVNPDLAEALVRANFSHLAETAELEAAE